jgi:hypothetical protein
MDDLEAVDGRYRILLAAELGETHYTDELTLVAVDHPAGVLVAPDLAGRFHTYPAPLAPRSARDQAGRDILPIIARDDDGFWVSRIEEKAPDRRPFLG